MNSTSYQIDRICENAASGAYLLGKYAKASGGPVRRASFWQAPALPGDAYRIESTAEGVRLYGQTAVTFNAAVGCLLRNGGAPSKQDRHL